MMSLSWRHVVVARQWHPDYIRLQYFWANKIENTSEDTIRALTHLLIYFIFLYSNKERKKKTCPAINTCKRCFKSCHPKHQSDTAEAVITWFWLNEVKTRRSGRQTDGSERPMCWHLKHARWERLFNGRERAPNFSLPLLNTSYGLVTNDDDTIRNCYFLTYPIPKFVNVNATRVDFFVS